MLVTALGEQERVEFARAMLDFARDEEETSHNRIEALVALRVVARSLPNGVRDELFESVAAFAEGRLDGSGGDELFPGEGDPLSRFRLGFGQRSLAPAGLTAAAALAFAAEQFARVEGIAVSQLRNANESAVNSVAAALASVPADRLSLAVEVLATHPSEWMRALAAVIWAQRPDLDVEIGLELARDPSRHVRASLVRSLRDDGRHASVREILRADPRRSLRREIASAAEDAGSSA